MVDPERLISAFERVRADLLAERENGHWVGELATSALSTATAVSALRIVERQLSGRDDERAQALLRLVVQGVQWLAAHQNDDGGWGDTDRSHSNIATTMLAVAAIHLTGVPADHAGLLERAEAYIDRQGRIAGLRRRYGRDKTFAVPILTNAALAGRVPWRAVSPLPFELACFPQAFYRFLRLPVVSYAIPALVAIGQARFFHRPPWNPFVRLWRNLSVERSLRVLTQIQPASGGYLEAVPLTSFVVMSLASTGRADHPVTQRGVDFLLRSVRPDGSWPIDTNLATWNTTLALNALAAGGDDLGPLADLDWLLGCQNRERHPYTGADPGGWGWSNLSGAVPDADDTPGALLALAAWYRSPSTTLADQQRIAESAVLGLRWLFGLQNGDGGWPTFCRGWGTLPFDRSGADLTAHVLRALHAWQTIWSEECPAHAESFGPDVTWDRQLARVHDATSQPASPARSSRERAFRRAVWDAAVARGFAYLERTQHADGAWSPLWFGNQDHPREDNPVYGTAKVLLAYRDCGRLDREPARRGLAWLRAAQNADGGWGCGLPEVDSPSSIEETSLAIEALAGRDDLGGSPSRGLEWLVERVEAGRHREPSPIGFYFAKLWYHETLYPLVFAASALASAIPKPHVRTAPTRTDTP